MVAVCSQSFIFSHTHLLSPENCQITNEQVDVWLWLQHHLLSNEETGPHSLLLRSPLLQPYFRTAAATGHWLPSSAKGNSTSAPTDTSTSASSSASIMACMCYHLYAGAASPGSMLPKAPHVRCGVLVNLLWLSETISQV